MNRRRFLVTTAAAQWCRCEKCRDFSASEQALIVENHILRALRAHISYSHTLPCRSA